MSYAKLRGRIREMFGTNKEFAKAMDLDTSSISMKLNGRVAWKREDIEKACEVLEIPIEDVYQYFFMKKVGNSQQEEA